MRKEKTRYNKLKDQISETISSNAIQNMLSPFQSFRFCSFRPNPHAQHASGRVKPPTASRTHPSSTHECLRIPTANCPAGTDRAGSPSHHDDAARRRSPGRALRPLPCMTSSQRASTTTPHNTLEPATPTWFMFSPSLSSATFSCHAEMRLICMRCKNKMDKET